MTVSNWRTLWENYRSVAANCKSVSWRTPLLSMHEDGVGAHKNLISILPPEGLNRIPVEQAQHCICLRKVIGGPPSFSVRVALRVCLTESEASGRRWL